MMIVPRKQLTILFSIGLLLAAGVPAFAAKDTERLQIQVAMMQSELNDLRKLIEDQAREIKRLSDLLGEQSATVKKLVQDHKLEMEAMQVHVRDLSDRLIEMRDRMAAPPASTAPPAAAATPVAGGPTTTAPTARPAGPASGAPLPGELFSQAYADYTRGQYELAAQEFREYVKLYPDTERSDDAQYWIGVCLSGKLQYAEAIAAWDTLLQNFPSSDKLPDAYVKKGGALEKLGKRREALTQYRYVVEHYPNAPAAKIAREKLGPPSP